MSLPVISLPVLSSGLTMGDLIAGGTEGSILFLGPDGAIAQDNAHLYFDNFNNFLGLGTNLPLAVLDLRIGSDLNIGQIIRANSSGQISNLTEWQNSFGSMMLSVGPTGSLISSSDLILSPTLGYNVVLAPPYDGGLLGTTLEFRNSSFASLGSIGCITGGKLDFQLTAASGAEYIFNEDKLDQNFRICGVTSSKLFVVDGASDSVGIGLNFPSAQLEVITTSASKITAIFRGTVAQSANLTQWRNASTTVLAFVDKDGAGSFAGLTSTNLTLGSALFAGTGGLVSQDNTNYFYDSGNTRLRVPKIAGSTSASGTLTLNATTNATKGKILFGTASCYNEVNDRLGIGTTDPHEAIHVAAPGNIKLADGQAIVWGGTSGSGGTDFQIGRGGTHTLEWYTNLTKRLVLGATGNFLVNGFTSSTVGVTIKGAASQSVALIEGTTSADVLVFSLTGSESGGNINGRLRLGSSNTGMWNTGGSDLILSRAGSQTIGIGGSGMYFYSNMTFNWASTVDVGGQLLSATFDTGIARSAAAVVKVTNGSSGSGNLSVLDEAYGSSWNGSTNVPTKNAIYDKIQTIASDVLFDHFADANNSGTGETDLYSDTLAAGQLAANGEKIVATYGGIFTGDATSTQQLKVYFGGTVIFDSGALAIGVATPSWDIKVTIIRVSSSVVRCSVSVTSSSATLLAFATYTEVTGLTLANTQIIKITGQAAGASGGSNQITAKESYVEFKPAA